jgi:uncharacterized repeat protein (TIGR03803 family)
MRNRNFSLGLTVVALVALTVLGIAPRTAAQTETVLYSFGGSGTDATSPYAGLIFDSSGNLYGTTVVGGAHNYGTVFELTPQTGGSWTEKTLYSFNNNGTDGYYPDGGLVFDASGNLYGTTSLGGLYGDGTVFELTPTPHGGWAEKILHRFSNSGNGGSYPKSSLVLDAVGNLYGTTYEGGADHYGAVFELIRGASGGWTERVLHTFSFNGHDGQYVLSGLTFDPLGNLYGTTESGGAHGYGIVFELTPTPAGGWTEKIPHTFNTNGHDGQYPYGGLIIDSLGNLYGTTEVGGTHNGGVVFELTPNSAGGWVENVLHSFADNGTDGYEPEAALILDSAGNLYGTTPDGGVYSGGTVFELSPEADADSAETILHSFNQYGSGSDGYRPGLASLCLDAAGNLYGTTPDGGAYGYGTVFEITP